MKHFTGTCSLCLKMNQQHEQRLQSGINMNSQGLKFENGRIRIFLNLLPTAIFSHIAMTLYLCRFCCTIDNLYID